MTNFSEGLMLLFLIGAMFTFIFAFVISGVRLYKDMDCMKQFKYEQKVIIVDDFYQTSKNGTILSPTKNFQYSVKLDNGDIIDVPCRSLGKIESVTA